MFERRKRSQQDFAEELKAHIALEADRLREAGMSEEAALAAARRNLGNVAQAKERFYEAHRWLWLDPLIQDLRFGLRQLRRNPGFTAVTVITLALGIGANTAIFSVVDAVLLRPLPYPRPQQLVSVWETAEQFKDSQVSAAGPDFLAWMHESSVFSTLAAGEICDPALTGQGEPEHLYGICVTPDFFKVLGVSPSIGRALLPDEGENAVVLGYGLWRRKFGGDPTILGRAVTLDGTRFTAVGIMPRAFRFPQIWGITEPESYIPLSLAQLQKTEDHSLWVIGRLKPGATIAQAQVQLATIAARLAKENPTTNAGVGINVQPLHVEVEQGMSGPLVMLLVATGFLLLIACANVANLLLGRASRRRQEIALRIAVGAHRWRIMRQLLTESVLLALLGCVPGIFLAIAGKHWLVALSPEGLLPQTNPINLNLPVFVFVVVVAVGTGILFGLAPALEGSKTNLQDSLKEGARTSAGAGTHRLRQVLVVAEVALALMLLIGSGLMVRSMKNVLNQSLGFNPHHVLTLSMTLPRSKYPKDANTLAFDRAVIRRVEALPGVRAAAFATIVPATGGGFGTVRLEGQPVVPEATGPEAFYGYVTGDYFRALGIPIAEGRAFADADYSTGPETAVVSRKFAETFWPKGNPIGRRFQIAGSQPNNWYRVVGVAQDVATNPGNPPVSEAWLPAANRQATLLVRTQVKPASLTRSIERQVWKVDADLPIYDVATMEQVLATSFSGVRYIVGLLGIFTLIALALAAIGIYAVMSYFAGERTHEIGIRLALGAQGTDVLMMVIGNGIRPALIGIGVGVVAALGLARLLSSMLYGVKPTDLVTFVAVSLILLGVALLACYIPARRAANVDPMVALRHE